MEGQKIWTSILTDIKSQVSSSTFKTWFGGSFVLDYKRDNDNDLLVVGLKNNFLKEQLERRYLPKILEITKKRGFLKTKVIFVVARNEKQQEPSKNGPLFSGLAPTYINSTRKVDNLNPSHTFENFVVGHSNNLAFLAFSQVAASLGTLYNPLFVYGATGVGKTHLLQALGNEVLNRMADAKVLYVSCEKFTNDYIESLISRAPAAFRQKYRGVDLLLVDDVQFLGGKESTQEEFFYTFNELHLSSRQLVLAADRHPKDLGKIKERLISRFLGGMTVDIQKPDIELRTAILKAKCKERGLELADDIVSYIASSCQAGAREIEGVLVQVLSLTKLSSGKITLEEIKSTIERSQAVEKVKPSCGEIIEKVSRHFRVARGDLCGPKRKAHLVWARQVLMYLLRSDLGFSLEGIGEIIGGRDHSTVLYGIEKVEREMMSNQKKKDEVWRVRSVL